MNHLIAHAVLVWGALILAGCASNNLTTPSPADPRSSEVRGLTVDPRDGRLLQARSVGLHQSRDGGKTWQRISLPAEIATKGVAYVGIRKDQPDIVYIAGESIGIWRSRDAGQKWQKVTRGLANERVTALAIHSNGYPRDSRKTLFAWVAEVGMFESLDDGENWRRSVDRGMGLENQTVSALIHSPLEGSMNTGWLYASTPAGAYLSMD